MTTLTAASLRGPVRSRSQITAVMRLLVVNPRTVIVYPLIVLAGIFLINLSIWILVDTLAPTAADRAEASRGFGFSGSATYVFVYMALVAIQAMNGSFRFAQGFGVTRRDYYLGTIAGFGVLAVGYSALLIVFGVIEQSTGGWGLGGHMFTPIYFGTTWGDRIIVELCLLLLSFAIGAGYGSMFVRWRGLGVLLLSGGLVVAMIAAAVLIQMLDAWTPVFGWIGDNAPTGLALWSLVLTAVFAVIGFVVLRRATPQG